MIPISTFNLLIAVFVVFVLYAIADYRNKFYANIVSAGIASFIGLYLSSMIYLGNVEYSNGTAISDLSLAIILFIPTLAMMVYTYLFAYDAYEEYTSIKENES